jgi:hypothetical protein
MKFQQVELVNKTIKIRPKFKTKKVSSTSACMNKSLLSYESDLKTFSSFLNYSSTPAEQSLYKAITSNR